MRKEELLSTFKGNNKLPVYNWFYFTEAYSKELVREIILKNPVKSKIPRLYDPFCGTGTSLLVAKEFGFESYGTDISFLMYLVSKGKCLNYNLKKIKKLFPKVLEIRNETLIIPNENKWIKKYFYSENLQQILKIKNNIDNLNEKEKYFFYVVLLKTIKIVSKARIQGADLRLRKIRKLDVSKKFTRIYNLFLKEYDKFCKKNNCEIEPEILNESCFTFYKTHERKFDYIICSPPYLNKTEYTKRFGIELAILGQETILTNHLGHIKVKQDAKKDWLYLKYFAKQLSQIKTQDYKQKDYDAHQYFKQFEIFVEQSVNHLNKNGVLAIVIAGGVIGNTIFDIFDYLQELYLLNKLYISDIKINREITANVKRTIKLGKIKEFTIVGRKIK